MKISRRINMAAIYIKLIQNISTLLPTSLVCIIIILLTRNPKIIRLCGFIAIRFHLRPLVLYTMHRLVFLCCKMFNQDPTQFGGYQPIKVIPKHFFYPISRLLYSTWKWDMIKPYRHFLSFSTQATLHSIKAVISKQRQQDWFHMDERGILFLLSPCCCGF